MDDHLEAGERRVIAAKTAFEGVAEALLSEREPTEETVGLMVVALVDAVLAGDQEVLAVLTLSFDRLRSYGDGCEFPSARLDGLLAGLQAVCGFARILLQLEYRRAAVAR